MNLDYVIIGGGTAGWLTALYIQKHLPQGQVTVIASSEIGILGAGEGTTPDFMEFLNQIDVSPESILENARGTIKKGIKFTNWNGDGKDFFHPFWGQYGEEALHFDANLLAQHLQKIGLSRGIRLVDDIVVNINVDEKDYITGFNLQSGNIVNCNFAFDCSGFKRLIIGNYYKSTWHTYAKSLPVNRAMPFFLDNDGVNLPEYTESIAMKYGWMWKIPVKGRYGCGYVFDSSFVTDEEIKQELEQYLGHEIVSPRMFSFEPGVYDKFCVKNCVAIGLSSGFVEPLEATSIWVGTMLLEYWGKKSEKIINGDVSSIDYINRVTKDINRNILNFIQFRFCT